MNWATACQPWELRILIAIGRRSKHSFNWATACQPWERHQAPPDCRPHDRVSIGPRRVSRGNVIPQRGFRRCPRSFNWATACQPWELRGCGNTRGRQGVVSIGPRRVSRGNGLSEIIEGSNHCMFQLGHGVSAVGTPSTGRLVGRTRGFNWATACQPWELVQKYALCKVQSRFDWATACQPWEHAVHWSDECGYKAVSIGPRRVSRGNNSPAIACRTAREAFQLGHGVSAVGTGPHVSRPTRPRGSFNWATACQPWELCFTAVVAYRVLAAFQLGHGVSAVGTPTVWPT